MQTISKAFKETLAETNKETLKEADKTSFNAQTYPLSHNYNWYAISKSNLVANYGYPN